MHPRRSLLAIAVAALGACTGAIGGAGPMATPASPAGGVVSPPDPASTGPAPAAAGSTTPAASPPPGTTTAPAPAPGALPLGTLRRLTRREYDNTVRDLTGYDRLTMNSLPHGATGPTGFEVAGPVSTVEAQAFMDIAEAVWDARSKDVNGFVGCDPARMGEDACAGRFIESFGKRAFRRPLDPDEIADLQALYKDARGRIGYDYPGAISVVTEAILQAPDFLYHLEQGATPGAREGGLIALTPYQVASRLSFFLWGTMPDAALFTAADKGQLASADDVEAQVRRMIASKTAIAQGLRGFYEELLHADLTDVAKNADIGMEWKNNGGQDVKRAEGEHLAAFVRWVVAESDGKLATLLTAPSAFVDQQDAAYYGLQNVKGYYPMKVDLPPDERAGILTQVPFLTANATSGGSHPVKRGQTVYTNLLCGAVGPVPANVPPPPAPAPNLSTRERFAMHDDAGCATCHKLFDPIGFAFEGYDAVGRVRTTDGGKPVDASGTVAFPSGGTASFKNAVELVRAIAASADARTCHARKLFQWATGRVEQSGDAAAMMDLQRRFADSGGDLRELMVAIARSRSFLYRAPVPGEVP